MKIKIKKFFNSNLIKKSGQITIVLLAFLLISGGNIKELSISNKEKPIVKYIPNNIEVQTTALNETNKNNLDLYLENNEEQIRFFATIFDMNYDSVVLKIREINIDPNNILENNIGQIKDELGNLYNYQNVDRGLLEFFLKLEQTNPEMINHAHRPCDKNPEYIEAVIQYFSSLYNNVDHKLMLSIAAAESGYFTSQNMLYKNNIYGGMGSNGLITYKNIEYGIMQYIKKMSEQYYDKGLNTIESIGFVFCPKMVNGIKVVSPHWLNLVNKALPNYDYEIRYVSVEQINDLGNNEI